MNKNSNVEIVHRSGNEISHSNCLVVAPYRKTANSQILATIEHYMVNDEPGGFPWKISPVLQDGVPLKEAMERAVQHACENAIPAILVNEHDFSTDVEKQRTDTKILKVSA